MYSLYITTYALIYTHKHTRVKLLTKPHTRADPIKRMSGFAQYIIRIVLAKNRVYFHNYAIERFAIRNMLIK